VHKNITFVPKKLRNPDFKKLLCYIMEERERERRGRRSLSKIGMIQADGEIL